MAKVSILFEDTEEGVLMTLGFEDPLPEDPAEATDAQTQGMIAFRAFLDWSEAAEGGEEEFDPEDWPEEAPSV